MRVMNNVGSLNAWRNLTATDNQLSKSLERLSSGFRINRAGDDAAGLAISENMRAQIRGFNQAVRNAQDGISLVQTAEGSLNETHSILQRMREIAVQSANGTLQPEDRLRIQSEMDNLAAEVSRITNASKFNNKDLIDGSLMAANVSDITLQIGPNAGQTVTLEVGAMDSKTLNIGRDVLTGFVDDGTHITGLTGGTTSVTDVIAMGAGVSLMAGYRVAYVNGAPGTLELEKSTDGGGSWTSVGGTVAFAAGNTTGITVGNVATGETFTITTGVAPGAPEDTQFTIPAGASAMRMVSTVDEVGAGLSEGQYQVMYDASTQKIQLKDTSGNDIGGAVAFAAGTQVTIGDSNTARTVRLTMGSSAPAATTTDVVTLASSGGKVVIDAFGLLDTTQGIRDVGSYLDSGTYRVFYDQGANNVQLQTAAGEAIGSAVTWTANTNLTIGDSITGRTVTIRTDAGAPGADTSAAISVTNNGKSTEAASFNGGAKVNDARAYAGLNVSSQTGASDALGVIDAAITNVSELRSELGAVQNRLEHTINNLQVVSENLVAAESRIRDVDMALEMGQFTKNQILMQSGTAMLAQANTKNQAVLQLLQGQ